MFSSVFRANLSVNFPFEQRIKIVHIIRISIKQKYTDKNDMNIIFIDILSHTVKTNGRKNRHNIVKGKSCNLIVIVRVSVCLSPSFPLYMATVAMGRCQSTPGLVETKGRISIEDMWLHPSSQLNTNYNQPSLIRYLIG